MIQGYLTGGAWARRALRPRLSHQIETERESENENEGETHTHTCTKREGGRERNTVGRPKSWAFSRKAGHRNEFRRGV